MKVGDSPHREVQRQAGQAIVEYALVLPLLLLLVLTAIVVSQVARARHNLITAAREAARAAAEIGAQEGAAEQAREVAESKADRVASDRGLNCDLWEVHVDIPANYPRDGAVYVHLTCEYPLVFDPSRLLMFWGGQGFGQGGSFRLEAESTFYIQRYKARWP